VRATLADPSYRRAAQTLAQEIAAMPTPAEVAGEIEAFTRR
jgi:UDP:flavonoid glycosyltransferase YjiC (YdhE family)